MDQKVLMKHDALSRFFAREKRLINVNDQLQWEKNEHLKEAYMQRRLKK